MGVRTMKFGLDENLGPSVRQLFLDAGHDCSTVLEQKLSGAADPIVAAVCHEEGRFLVTLDTDFANPMRFPPANTAGVAVLRPGDDKSRAPLRSTVQTFLRFVESQSVASRLVVVDPLRVRIYPRTDEFIP
jgi:predicted nuclease of predicted toxin-antitoxin system